MGLVVGAGSNRIVVFFWSNAEALPAARRLPRRHRCRGSADTLLGSLLGGKTNVETALWRSDYHWCLADRGLVLRTASCALLRPPPARPQTYSARRAAPLRC